MQRPAVLGPVKLDHGRAKYLGVVAHREQQTGVPGRELLADNLRRCGDERIVSQRALNERLNVRPHCRRLVLTHFVDCDHVRVTGSGSCAGQN